MANEVLAELDRQNIIFDVVDGIPLSGDESDEVKSFRSQIESDNTILEFSAEESCGKCFPGRLGSYRGKEMFDQVKNKSAKIPLKLLNELLVTMQKGCLCALCGAIPTPIMNILKYFGDEIKNDIVKDN